MPRPPATLFSLFLSLFRSPAVLEIDSMWMMMLGPGDSTVAHKHPKAFLSGVVWLNSPEALLGPASEGTLKLRDPRVQTSIMDSTEWYVVRFDRPSVSPRCGTPRWHTCRGPVVRCSISQLSLRCRWCAAQYALLRGGRPLRPLSPC